MSKPEQRKARKLTIDRLEERVAPAAMGGLVQDAGGVDDGAAFDGAIDGDIDSGFDGAIEGDVLDAVDPSMMLDGDVSAIEGSDFSHGFGDGADFHDDGSVSFSAPEGFEFDASGTLDISAEDADGLIPAFPEGTVHDLDGYITYDLPDNAVLSDAGVSVSGDIDAGFVAPFVPGAEIQPDGTYSFPIPTDLKAVDGELATADGAVLDLPEGTVVTGDTMIIAGSADATTLAHFSPDALVEGDTATFVAPNLEIDPAAGTFSVPTADAPAFDGFFPPGGSVTPDGGFHYEAPDGFEANSDGSITVPAYDTGDAVTADAEGDLDESNGGDGSEAPVEGKTEETRISESDFNDNEPVHAEASSSADTGEAGSVGADDAPAADKWVDDGAIASGPIDGDVSVDADASLNGVDGDATVDNGEVTAVEGDVTADAEGDLDESNGGDGSEAPVEGKTEETRISESDFNDNEPVHAEASSSADTGEAGSVGADDAPAADKWVDDGAIASGPIDGDVSVDADASLNGVDGDATVDNGEVTAVEGDVTADAEGDLDESNGGDGSEAPVEGKTEETRISESDFNDNEPVHAEASSSADTGEAGSVGADDAPAADKWVDDGAIASGPIDGDVSVDADASLNGVDGDATVDNGEVTAVEGDVTADAEGDLDESNGGDGSEAPVEGKTEETRISESDFNDNEPVHAEASSSADTGEAGSVGADDAPAADKWVDDGAIASGPIDGDVSVDADASLNGVDGDATVDNGEVTAVEGDVTADAEGDLDESNGGDGSEAPVEGKTEETRISESDFNDNEPVHAEASSSADTGEAGSVGADDAPAADKWVDDGAIASGPIDGDVSVDADASLNGVDGDATVDNGEVTAVEGDTVEAETEYTTEKGSEVPAEETMIEEQPIVDNGGAVTAE